MFHVTSKIHTLKDFRRSRNPGNLKPLNVPERLKKGNLGCAQGCSVPARLYWWSGLSDLETQCARTESTTSREAGRGSIQLRQAARRKAEGKSPAVSRRLISCWIRGGPGILLMLGSLQHSMAFCKNELIAWSIKGVSQGCKQVNSVNPSWYRCSARSMCNTHRVQCSTVKDWLIVGIFRTRRISKCHQ